MIVIATSNTVGIIKEEKMNLEDFTKEELIGLIIKAEEKGMNVSEYMYWQEEYAKEFEMNIIL